MKIICLPVIGVFLALLNGCTNFAGTDGEGNSSETIAHGVIMDSSGIPVANVPVQLLPDTYNPVAGDSIPAGWHAYTDAFGNYRITSATTVGTYTLEAGSAAMKALIRNIHITDKNSNVAIDTAKLQKTGTIIVKIAEIPPLEGDYVYLPGTSTFTTIAATDRTAGHAVLSDVPAGIFTAIIYSAADGLTATNIISQTMTIYPGDTITSAYAAWSYERKVVLNTSASGADIQENVHNFPVLIRLNSTTFDFAQTKTAGEDIRFAKPDGSALAYEIERWDPAAGLAEMWVRIDTILGNNTAQYFTMYWGNSAAQDFSNSTAVFNTASGFEGVWHLQNSTGIISDATPNRNDGTRNGDLSQSAGYIGYGQYFGGSGYSETANLKNADTSGFTVCAWIRHGVLKQRQTIISKSSGGLPSPSYGWLIALDETGTLQAFTASDTGVWGDAHTLVLNSKTAIADTSTWHHIAVTINRTENKNCRLFIDGADVTLPTGDDITTVGSVVNTFPVRIGSDNGNGDTKWKGLLDECSVSLRARSSDWIRLSYMNQREDNELIEFK